MLLYLPYLSRETHLRLLVMTKWDLSVRCLKYQMEATSIVINKMAREISGIFLYSVMGTLTMLFAYQLNTSITHSVDPSLKPMRYTNL